MTATMADVRAEMSKPENANRAVVLVREDGDELVAEWDGREVRADNIFGLDSRLSDIGARRPRNLFLVSAEDYAAGVAS